MSSLKDELTNLINAYGMGKDVTQSTVGLMQKEDQADLAEFARKVALNWMGRPVDNDDVALFIYGFMIGHDWVKKHWALW